MSLTLSQRPNKRHLTTYCFILFIQRTIPDFGWSQHPNYHCFIHPHPGTSGFKIQVTAPICARKMVKYFCSSAEIKSRWDHVVSAFWQRYPNPFSTHVLTEDVVYREVTADNQLFSRRLLMKTNRLPRWAERFFPAGMSRSVYIIEDSIVDPISRSLTTYTWNLNHTTLMCVEERCVFRDSAEQPGTTQLKREAWISSSIYGFSKPIQEFGLARFKSNQTKAMKGLEYALSNLQGETTQRLLRDTVKDASEKAKEAAKTLASAAAPQKPQQFV